MLFPYFVYITHITKFTRGIFAHGKIFAHGDQKGKKVHGTKRKKKNRPKEERKYHSVKKRKNFFVKVTSNCDFESCMAIRCLASQHIFRFYHFCRGFFLCSLLCRPPQRSLSDRDKTINVSAIVTFPRKS